MKRVLIMILCLTNLIIFAQDKSFDLGGNLGFGTSFLYNHPFIQPKPNVSYSSLVGFSFVYTSPKKFSMMTDLNYENKGWTGKVVFTDLTGKEIGEKLIRTSLHSVSLSIMPGFITRGKTKFFLNAGPSLNYLIEARKPFGKYPNPPFHYFVLGLDLKLGIQKQISNKIKLNVFLQNRLDIQIRNIITMNSVLIGAGVYYNLGKKKE